MLCSLVSVSQACFQWFKAFHHFNISTPFLDSGLLPVSSLATPLLLLYLSSPPPHPHPLVISTASLNLLPLWVGCTSGSYFAGGAILPFTPVRWQVLRDINHLFQSGDESQALVKTRSLPQRSRVVSLRKFIVQTRSSVWVKRESDCNNVADWCRCYSGIFWVTHQLGFLWSFESMSRTGVKKKRIFFFFNVNTKILRIPQTESLLNLSKSVWETERRKKRESGVACSL